MASVLFASNSYKKGKANGRESRDEGDATMANKIPEKIANRIKIAAAYAHQHTHPHTRSKRERERERGKKERDSDRDQTKLWPEQKL